MQKATQKVENGDVETREEDIVLYFKSMQGRLHYFRGEQKITDIVKSGLWDKEFVKDDKKPKIIHFVVAKRQPQPEQ